MPPKKLFGTDGVRGVANRDITPELALKIGLAAGRALVESGEPRKVVLGRDTRRSGSALGAALASGLTCAGVDVVALGVAPTGAISFLARRDEFGLGAVISASHNPAPDNGIKLIGSTGAKVTAEFEARVEELVAAGVDDRPTGAEIGAILADRSPLDTYRDALLKLVPERLEGLSVVVDGANGAAYELGAQVFRELGADVIAFGDAPDGVNINADGGATKPGVVQGRTEAEGAAMGVAFDGDADRAVFADSKGRLINGDRTMAVWCEHKDRLGELSPRAAVGTVMSNGGFERHMQEIGVTLHRTKVGDKYVAAKLVEIGGMIGGEQSGHVIFPAFGPTGDGLVTALEFARVLKREGKTAAELYESYESWPQLLVNIGVDEKEGWEDRPAIREAIQAAESHIKGRGRINVRASGTQPMIRVMVEADDAELRDRESTRVVDALISELGGNEYSRVDLTHALGD